MTALSELRGRVVDEEREPVADASVVVSASSVPVPEIALLTDDDGAFARRLPAGTFTLRAEAPSGTGEAEVRTPAAWEVVIAVRDRPACDA